MKNTKLTLKLEPLLKGIDRIANEAAAPYLFGYPNFYDEKNGKENSPYYWWFQYLKRHDGYRKCCERKGEGRHAALYKDWGDIRTADFEEWFFEYGAIFREPEVPDVLAEITDTSQLENVNWNAVMVVICPVKTGSRSLSKRDMKRQFSDLLDRKFPIEKAGRRTYTSEAKYRVTGYPKLQALKEMLAVWDLRLAEPSLKLWEICERLHDEGNLSVAPHQVIKRTDTADEKAHKKAIMANVISRHLKIASAYIDSSAGKVFPLKKATLVKKR